MEGGGVKLPICRRPFWGGVLEMQTVADMRGIGVKNREKIADVLCGRPLSWIIVWISLELDLSIHLFIIHLMLFTVWIPFIQFWPCFLIIAKIGKLSFDVNWKLCSLKSYGLQFTKQLIIFIWFIRQRTFWSDTFDHQVTYCYNTWILFH